MNSMKSQKDLTLKDELPRLVGRLLPVPQAHLGPLPKGTPGHQERQLQGGACVSVRALPAAVQHEVHDPVCFRESTSHFKRGPGIPPPHDG